MTAQPASEAGGPAHQFRDVANTLRRRKSLILSVTVAGTLLVTLAALSIQPSYTATAEIIIDPNAANVTPGSTRQPLAGGLDDATVDTEIATLNSEVTLCLALQAVAKLPQAAGSGEAAANGRPSLIAQAVQQARAGLSSLLAAIPLRTAAPPAVKEPETCGHTPGSRLPQLAELKVGIKVFQQRRSSIIAVSYAGRDPALTAAIVNEIVRVHIDRQTAMQRGRAERIVGWLDEQIARQTKQRADIETQIRQHQLAGGSDDTGNLRALADTEQQLTLVEAALQQRQALLDRVSSLQARGADAVALATALGIQPTPSQGASSRLSQDVDEAIRRLRGQKEFARAQAIAIREDLQAKQKQAEALAGRQAPLKDLEERAAAVTRLIADLQARRDASIQERDLPVVEASVFTLARVPQRPSSMPPAFMISPGVVAFFLLGTMLAITWDRLDRSFRKEKDVADTLGVPCVGLVPEMRRPTALGWDERAPAPMRPSYREAVRTVLASVMGLASDERESRVVLVTSSVPEEGKSTLATSLGACAADLGLRVLLIDLGHGTDTSAGAGARHGSPAGSRGAASADGVIMQKGVGFDYLPGAGLSVDLFSYLISEQGRQLFPLLRQRYDCILIDAPALLESVEARIATSVADKVLLAVRWGRTKREVSRYAVGLLRQSGLVDQSSRPRLLAALTRADLPVHVRYKFGDAAEVLFERDRDRSWRRRLDSPKTPEGTPSRSTPRPAPRRARPPARPPGLQPDAFRQG